MDKDQIDTLASRIAQVIASESKPADLSSITASIDAIGERLTRLEAANVYPRSEISNFRSQIPDPKTNDASRQRFNIAEAIADSVFGQAQTEKTCTFEPNDKPCDHCSMCSTRGF